MGLQPDPSHLIYHKAIEYKGMSAGYTNLFSLLSELGRSEMEFINSLVVIVTPAPDISSDFNYTDRIELLMKVLIDLTYHTQVCKINANAWNLDGDMITNLYWTFYPFANKNLGYDDIQFECATTDWLITETQRVMFIVDVYSLPNARQPRMRP